jgi:CheY-like chemotaxis protein
MAMTEKQTVLVVEDDPLIREIMLDVLEDEGFNALCAEGTNEAIAKIEHNHGDEISAIFADIDLGDRGGGYEVARCARLVKPGIRIIYTSGGAREDFMKERVEGAIFVQKPYVPSQVCTLLRQKSVA